MSGDSEQETEGLDTLFKDNQGTSVSETPKQPDLNRVSNADLFSLLTTFMNNKFSGIENNLSETTKDLAKKVKKVENTFKFKGHQVQYEFNSDLQDNIEKAVDLIKSKRFSRAETTLVDSLASIKKRNKLIRIADKSEGGWKTVQEYLSDEVASNSDDEKKIRAADSRAIRKLKAGKSNKQNPRKRPAEAAGSVTQVPRNSGGVYSTSFNMQPFRGSGQPGVAHGKRDKAGEQCHNCGLFGHWARECRKDSKTAGGAYGRGPAV